MDRRLVAIAADIAGDGDTALELLSVNAYDIAVLDRDIPGPADPITIAETMPPGHASTGITTSQLFELAYTGVAAAPASTPTTPPITASRIDSPRNCVRIWPCVAPRARRKADLRAAFQHRDDH
jgi:hypothetical protein